MKLEKALAFVLDMAEGELLEGDISQVQASKKTLKILENREEAYDTVCNFFLMLGDK